MGVYGLWRFMTSQRTLIKKYYLHDTKLVIDANNLYYFIQLESGISNEYGGDYHVFADKVKSFFGLLRKCRISPYLVFNGRQQSDQRLNRNISKAHREIRAVQKITKGETEKLVPELGFETFKHIIDEIGIPFVVDYFCVRKTIAMLANEWKCPVLSNGSDFFMFYIEGGFVLLEQLDFPTKTIKNERTGKTITSLYCNFYDFKNFIKMFPGLDINMLPLLNGVNSWSDDDQQRLFANFHSHLEQAPEDFGIRITAREKCSHLLSLLYWLKNQSSISEAIGNVTRFIATEERDRAIKIMQDAVDCYKQSESSFNMKNYFETNQFEFSVNATNMMTENGNPLPQWFLKSLKSGNISRFCYMALCQQTMLLSSQVENLEWESSHACSRHIRQVIYGILILHDIDRLPASEQFVKEYDRNGIDIEKHVVKPIFELDNFGPLPALNDIFTASLDIRKQVLLSVLGVSTQFLEKFPTELKLVAATIVYWVKNSTPDIQKLMVSCLVACILYLWVEEFCQYSPQQKDSMQETAMDPSSLVKLMLDCEKKDLDLVEKNLIKMCGLPSTNYRKKIDIAIVHSFSQFQSCLHYAVYLNSLLLKPFVATSPHLIYCGTFLNNIFHDNHQQTNPQGHIADAFGTDSILKKLFLTMDEAFHSLLEPCYQVKEQSK